VAVIAKYFNKEFIRGVVIIIYMLWLLFLAYKDICEKKLGNVKLLVLFLISSVYVLLDIHRVNVYIFNFLVSFSFYFILYFLLHKKEIGGADIKLLVIHGFMLGFWESVKACMLGCIIAILVNILYIRRNTLKTFALVPYLVIGMVGLYCFG